MITRDTQVEEIVEIPGIITYFIERGVSPISCSDAFPNTLGKLLSLKKVSDPDLFIKGLNDFIKRSES